MISPTPWREGQFLHEPLYMMKWGFFFADLLLCELMHQFKLISFTIYYNRSDNSHHRVYGICAIWDLLKYRKKITLNISKWHQNLIKPPIYPFYAHTIPWWAYWDEVNTTLKVHGSAVFIYSMWFRSTKSNSKLGTEFMPKGFNIFQKFYVLPQNLTLLKKINFQTKWWKNLLFMT